MLKEKARANANRQVDYWPRMEPQPLQRKTHAHRFRFRCRAKDNPVILYHESAMICAVNTKALQLAGVTKQTAVPKGGNIEKNPKTGNPQAFSVIALPT